MFKKTKAIVTFVTLLSSTGVTLAAGSSYIGASIAPQIVGAGMTGNVFGGYGATLDPNNKLYLGGELSAHVGKYYNSATSYGLGASVMPGIMVTKSTMIYGRLGLDSKRSSSNLLEIQSQVGMGVQTELTKKIGLRGEYTSGQFGVGLLYKFD